MKTISRALLLTLSLIFFLPAPSYGQGGDEASAQDIQFEHLTTEQGLSSNIVWSVLEDSHGFIWIGTMDGLNRFDRQVEPGSASAQFTRFKYDPTDPDSLSHSSVVSIVEDRSGTLWFGTLARGLNRFDRESASGMDAGRFTHYQNDPGDPHSLSHNIVRSLYVDNAGTLWIGTFGGGLNRFDGETQKFIRSSAKLTL